MKREEKYKVVEEMKEKLSKAEATFLVDYRGLNVKQITALRNELRKIGTEFFVVKNRLLKIACEGTPNEAIKEMLKGPNAIAISYEDIVTPAKVLVSFSDDYEKLEIKTGQMYGRLLNVDEIKQLSKLPGKMELLAMTLSAMKSVPGSFVRVLNGIILKLLYVLKAIEAKKAEENK